MKDKIKRLIDKHQETADNYHDMSKVFYTQGLFEKSLEVDNKAHPHESFAAELRLLIHE